MIRDRPFGRHLDAPDRPMWRMFRRWMFNRPPGAGLARLEAATAFAALLRRLDQPRLVEEPTWLDVFPFRTLNRLEIAWT